MPQIMEPRLIARSISPFHIGRHTQLPKGPFHRATSHGCPLVRPKERLAGVPNPTALAGVIFQHLG